MGLIAPNLGAFEQMVSHWIRIIDTRIDLFAVVIIVAGIVWASYLFVKRSMGEQHYDVYKLRIGRSLLFGLAVLVAADIVKTIAFEPTFMSLGALVGLVLVRKFVNWTLALEIEGLALALRDASGSRARSLAFRTDPSAFATPQQCSNMNCIGEACDARTL